MTKEKKYEKYVLLIISIVAVVLGVLVLLRIVNPTNTNGEQIEEGRRYLIGGIFIACGILSGFISIKSIVLEIRINKYSIFNTIIESYKNNKITNYLVNRELDESKIYYEDDNLDESLLIGYKQKFGSFTCYITKEEVIIVFDYNEDYLENKSDEEIEKLPLASEVDSFSSLNINEEDVYNKYINFINSNIVKLEGLE